MLLIIILAIFAATTIYACLVLSSRKDAEAEYTYQQFLKEQEEMEKKDAGKDSKKRKS